MEKLKRSVPKTGVWVLAAMAFAWTLSFNLATAKAGDVEEKDIVDVTRTTDQGVQNEWTGVSQEATETDVFGEAVADTDRPSAAAEAKDNFSSGFKGVGAGFKNGTKATGRAFKKAGTTMGRGFKTAGRTMETGFKKAGHGIKWFFTGQWLGHKDSVEERDVGSGEIQTEYNAAGKTSADDDLDLDVDHEEKPASDDWV